MLLDILLQALEINMKPIKPINISDEIRELAKDPNRIMNMKHDVETAEKINEIISALNQLIDKHE